ncbi:MAG: WD40 repeat domain-containing protein [bacterium]|nr:WD40 repeat domain-containing protein [bacterium]
MEKVFINPVAKEILIKGNAKEGPVDLFSYDNNTNSQALGNLFVIGNIQGRTIENSDDIDVGYVLNLVASLAKREYYANPDASPKDAFSGALKKINGVVEEFFKNKETKINIGIFAIANDQIHISKLGKFKIILAREGKNIDILNNIQLFNKETIEEKEFSNIISGKIIEGDHILAFYPSRSTTAREKSIKDNFLKTTQDEFTAQLMAIKETKPEFACAALHIDIQKFTEPLLVGRQAQPQPKELQQEPVEKETADDLTPAVQLATTESKKEDVVQEKDPAPTARTVVKLSPEPAIPKIIPSEFARGKRELILSKHFRRFKNMNTSPKTKAYAMGGVAIVILITVFSLKSFVFVDATTRQLNAVISEAQTNLKLAQDKLSQSDFIGARGLLMSSLASISQNESTNGPSKKADETKNQLMLALDSMDNATDATLTSPIDIPVDSGTAKLVTSSGTNFYAYLEGKDSNSLLKISADGAIAGTTQIKDISPSAIFSSDAYIALIDANAKKVSSLSISKSTLTTKEFSSDTLVNLEVYQDNLYGLTATGIIRIIDASLGKTDVQPWLASDTTLVNNASLIAVDGDIYILSSDGVLTKYYKGKKVSDVKTVISPDSGLPAGQVGSMLLTTTDSPNLYLVNASTGRIYIFAKDSGVVSKTLKINSAQPISSATLSSDGTIYILSGNKIWKVQ